MFLIFSHLSISFRIIDEMTMCNHRQINVIPNGLCSVSFKPKSLDYNDRERLILVSGRKILTILGLHDEKLSFNCSLLTKERENLNCCDAKWSPFSNSTLATAEKCKIQLWNLQIAQKDKFVTEFKAAEQRALNKISFSRFKKDVLISGSQDSKISGFDIHSKKKIFELAYSDEIVRDVQFSPTRENYIAANYDDGLLAVWDLRKTDQPMLKYQAHTETAFCLAWHPDQSFIATGGRDKKIRICSVKSGEMECCFTLHALNNPVAHVCWIPHSLDGRTLASISLLGDNFINFWDITKPFSVPYKRCIEQKHALVDFIWISKNDLISCSNDGWVMTHDENDAVIMSDSINEISLACNNMGVVQHTYKPPNPIVVLLNKELDEAPLEMLRPQWSMLKSAGMNHSRKLTPRDRSQSFNLPKTINSLQPNVKNPIHIHSLSSTTTSDYDINPLRNNSKVLSDPIIPIYNRSKEFVLFAQGYRFSGESPIALCRSNEKVAKKLGREDIAFLWYFCQCLLTDMKRITQGVMSFDTKDHAMNSQGKIKGHYLWDLDFEGKHTHTRSIPVTPHLNNVTFFDTTAISGQTEPHDHIDKCPHPPQGDCELEEKFETCSPPNKVIDVFSVINKCDKAWWADTDVNVHSMSGNKFSPYKDMKLHSATTPKHLVVGDSSANETGLSLNKTEEIIFKKPLKIAQLNLTDSLTSMINHLVDNGEIQHVVFMYICVHEKLLREINPFIFTHWTSSYIDILQSFNLDVLACELYKFLHTLKFYQDIRENDDKTNFSTLRDWDNSNCMGTLECKSCQKPVRRITPCEECNAWPRQLCSICRLPVYGLCTWCKGCQHGGHREHLLDWFETEKMCPTGCGHVCVI